MNARTTFTLLAASLLAGITGSLVAGPLDPPSGAISSTYKTLSDVEPRTRITGLPFTINTPGSYYLTGNMTAPVGTAGITINASNVTIDLNGFTIAGGTNAQSGIVSGSDTSSITIRNGNVRGWNVGINLATTSGIVIEKVDASKCVQQGIFAGTRATVRDCTASENGAYGIYASNYSIVSGCNATRNGGGIMTAGNSNVFDCHASDSQNGCGLNIGGASTVTQCTATNNTSSGIEVGSRVTVRGCTAYGNGGTGIVTQANCIVTESTAVQQFASGGGINAGAGSTVTNCNASSNGGSGIRVSANSRVIGNLCQGNGNGEWPGIHATGTGNRIEANSLIGNQHGLRVDSADNLIIANSARQNPAGAYSIPAGNEYGQILTSPGSSFSSTNPWANFAY